MRSVSCARPQTQQPQVQLRARGGGEYDISSLAGGSGGGQTVSLMDDPELRTHDLMDLVMNPKPEMC